MAQGHVVHPRQGTEPRVLHTQDTAMPQLCTGRGPAGGDTNRSCVAPARYHREEQWQPQGEFPARASPTFEEVKLPGQLGPGAGVDAGGEAGPAWLQWPWVTGVATRCHHPVVAALEDVEVVVPVCEAEGGCPR